jgi:aminoacrylate peracid reductase
LHTIFRTARPLGFDNPKPRQEIIMAREVVTPKNSAPALAPYSPAIKVDGILYMSGMLAMDNTGQIVGEGDVTAQTRQVLEMIASVLLAAGGTMGDIVFNSIFLRDLADYAAMNDVYRRYFPKEPPARYCIRADLVKPEFLVEISSIAHIGSSRVSSVG